MEFYDLTSSFTKTQSIFESNLSINWHILAFWSCVTCFIKNPFQYFLLYIYAHIHCMSNIGHMITEKLYDYICNSITNYLPLNMLKELC